MDPIRPVAAGASSPEGAPAAAPDLVDLLRACGRGDETAFARLYDATASRVVGLAVRVVRDPAQAEEVAQEAFLEIWRTAGRFDPAKGSPLGWLLTIVHRKAVDRVRSVEAATSRDETWNRETAPTDHDQTAEAAHASLDAARAIAGSSKLFVIGGAEVFSLCWPIIGRLELTEVHGDIDGDTRLAGFNRKEWREVFREAHAADAKHAWPFSFVTLVRLPAAP